MMNQQFSWRILKKIKKQRKHIFFGFQSPPAENSGDPKANMKHKVLSSYL